MGNTKVKTGSYAAAVAKCLTAFFDSPEIVSRRDPMYRDYEALKDICYDKEDKEFYYGYATGRNPQYMLVWQTSSGLGWWEPLPEHLDEIGEMSETEKVEWINGTAKRIEELASNRPGGLLDEANIISDYLPFSY